MEIQSKVPDANKQALKLYDLATRGKYKEGSIIARNILKKFPNDFYFTYQYAKLLGDWADDLPKSKCLKLKQEASKILKSLTRKLSGQSVGVRFGVCLNYYYQTYSFKKMYYFGKRFESVDKRKSFYAQALGAGLLAEELHFKYHKTTSKKWAQKSIKIWGKYDLNKETYYFPFYSLATSYLILGDKDLAMRNLQKAAKVSKRKVSCKEFSNLYKLINKT